MSKHPATEETNLNSGGTATHRPDTGTEARAPRGATRNGGKHTTDRSTP